VDEIINTNPQEWIILRNFKYRYPVGDQEYDTYCTKCDYPLEEISILNKTEWPISSILVLLIAYDKTDTPVDYQTYSFFTDENILPSLAKTVRIPGKSIMKPGKFGKIEYRILDYKIHDD